MIRLETDRLIIRDHKESDLSDYHKWISDSDLMYYVDWKTSSLEESQKDLTETIKENTNPNRTNYFLAILKKDTKSYIGTVGFMIKSRKVNTGIAECGYFLMKKYWGKGIAVEAITKILEFAFNELNLHKMSASCYKKIKRQKK
ncbi:MAG: GNAT family N-acetyltransferase [bacterium]|nr:GNAT family N-acetyltransferase [bacterium]